MVLELIPIPRRDKETVFSSPVQIISNRFFLSDLGDAAPLDDVIDGAAGVALRLGCHTGWNELHPAANGWHRRPAAERMGVLQQYPVMGIDWARGRRLLQSIQRVPPFIGIGQRATVGVCRSRPHNPQTVAAITILFNYRLCGTLAVVFMK